LEPALAGTAPLDLTSLDLSLLSVEALDEVLRGSSFSIVDEDDLLERVLGLGDEYRPLLDRIEIRFLSATGLAIVAGHFAFLPECVFCSILGSLRSLFPSSGWDSAIVPDFPNLFENFKQKRFTLLWRGGRDGFRALDFHIRCDGHPNALTVIVDMDGNIFGGFTPVEWDSRSGSKVDLSLKSFLFTLKNPHNVPGRRFMLKAEKKEKAIYCSSTYGPSFQDICVSDNGNATTNCYIGAFGAHYTNDIGLAGETFFRGPEKF
jgi:hypothetical protein